MSGIYNFLTTILTFPGSDSRIDGLFRHSAQFGKFCHIEACQHGDDTALGAVELGEGCADACVDLVSVILDVLADRGVDDVLLGPVEEVRSGGDQRVGLDVNFDRCHTRSHFTTSNPSTRVPELRYTRRWDGTVREHVFP